MFEGCRYNGNVRLRLVAAFLLGTVFYAVLPTFAQPIVLQWEDVLPFLIDSGAGVAAGAVLRFVAGSAWGMPLVLMCALVGALLHVVVYAIPTYGSGITRMEQVLVGGFTLVHMGVLAVLGAALTGLMLALVARLRRNQAGF